MQLQRDGQDSVRIANLFRISSNLETQYHLSYLLSQIEVTNKILVGEVIFSVIKKSRIKIRRRYLLRFKSISIKMMKRTYKKSACTCYIDWSCKHLDLYTALTDPNDQPIWPFLWLSNFDTILQESGISLSYVFS